MKVQLEKGLLLVLVAVFVVVISACQTFATTPADLIRTVCSPSQYQIERCASGVVDAYAVFQKQALNILKDPSTPKEAKDALKKVDKVLSPQVIALNQANLNYVSLKSSTQSAPIEIESAKAALNRQLAEVKPQVENAK